YDALVAEYPDHAQTWLSLGHALKTAGHTERSIAAYLRCVELMPEFGDAYWSLANLKTFRFTDAHVAAMQSALGRADLPEQHRLTLAFALGRALEDRGDSEASFRHYDAGNELRLRREPYDAADTTLRLQRAKEVYTPEFFAARAGSGCAAPDPIFIV